jgi:tetratricopeptide (TPR) repeat protein
MPSSRAMIARRLALGALFLMLLIAPAMAVMSGGEGEPPPSGDADDYGQGVAAFVREDWQAVVDHMTRTIEQRPWHDDAHNLLGFAYRKLGDYDHALRAYDQALVLNPHHRGALEYLGEAYLELDRPERAREMLDRLEVECRLVAVDAANDGWQSSCEEWRDLSEAYAAYVAEKNGE